MASSLYRSLDPQKCEIRILTILPCGDHVPPVPLTQSESVHDESSTNAAEIHCVLQTVSLEDEPSYTALSYNWGTDVPSTAVLINSKSIFVRRNLAAALRHLQQKDISLNIWVDAICINQDDNKEKSSQVQMMAKIYEKSVGVLVWLGPAADESDAAMEKLRDIGEKAIDAGMQDFRATDMPNWFNPDLEDRLQRLKTSLDGLADRESLEIFHPALIPLSKRTYWTRVWVLQEFSIHKTAMIQCGSKLLDVTTFGTALNFCAFARWTLSSRHKLEDYRDPKSKLRSVSGSANSPSGAPNQLFGARRRYYSETGERETLWSLLERTCMSDSAVLSLNATDPRDKIYGLLGLATDSEQLCILPDYDKSITEVYTDTSRRLIATGETSILSWCQQSTRVEGLPSWVPDFASDVPTAYGGSGRNRGNRSLFSASSNTKFPGLSLSLQNDPDSIGLSGIKVGIITDLGSVWTPALGLTWSWKDATRLIHEVEAFCKQSTMFNSPEQALDASMRIPCADQQFTGNTRRRASNSIRSQYDRIRSIGEFGSDHDAILYRHAMTFQRDRRPFLSNSGHVGLAPARAEPGDCICIIFGSPVPYILRSSTEGEFVLIGEAYAYGIMDGEWLDNDQASLTFFIH